MKWGHTSLRSNLNINTAYCCSSNTAVKIKVGSNHNLSKLGDMALVLKHSACFRVCVHAFICGFQMYKLVYFTLYTHSSWVTQFSHKHTSIVKGVFFNTVHLGFDNHSWLTQVFPWRKKDLIVEGVVEISYFISSSSIARHWAQEAALRGAPVYYSTVLHTSNWSSLHVHFCMKQKVPKAGIYQVCCKGWAFDANTLIWELLDPYAWENYIKIY